MCNVRQTWLAGAGVVVLLSIGAFAFRAPEYPEASTIGGGVSSNHEINSRFIALAQEKGAAYAFAVLARADLSQGGNLHGAAHSIAGVLYEQEGATSLGECPEQFQPACGHEFASRTLLEFGLSEGARQYAAACGSTPGGQLGYAGCFHGLGHGLLQHLGYDISEALAACQTEVVGESIALRECAGGAIMELLRGGDTVEKENPQEWYAARERYLSQEEPLKFCMGPLIPEEYRAVCLSLSAPWFLEFTGFHHHDDGTVAARPALQVCESIPLVRQALRNACFGGFGTEFVLIVGGHEISRSEDYDAATLQVIADNCRSAPSSDGTVACTLSAANALSRLDTPSHSVSEEFCALSGDSCTH